MKVKTLIISILILFSANLTIAQYNNLVIPEAYYGTVGPNGRTFNLTIKDTIKQFKTGNPTVTGSYSSPNQKNNFWGPTLIMNKDEVVHMNVTNSLNEATTVHWHGSHLPAIMDGGPHQVVAVGALWQPFWSVKNQAATLWYHPHMHATTQAQLTKGIGGFMIVKDAAEAALAIPRTYGVDDNPLALSSRRFLSTTNAMASFLSDNYGDYAMVNGTLNPQVSLPKQVVRLRFLNAEVQRAYNIGFSDNRTFYVIANDGGLLEIPIPVTRLPLSTGERVEILVDLSGSAIGSSLDLKAYNTTAEITALTPGQNPFGWPGLEGNPTNPTGGHGPLNGGLLNNTTFTFLHINIAAATTTPITAIPTSLITNTYWTPANVTNSRTITVSGGQGGTAFGLDNVFYSDALVPKTVALDAYEKWTIVNNNIFGHTFHLHDVAFKVISRSGGNIGTTLRAYEQGWKDSIWLPIGGTVVFIAKFDDYADSTWPYMYHCHALTHEDEGMMGQFVVTSSLSTNQNMLNTDFSLYPNPATDLLYINLKDTDTEIYYVTITSITGRVVMMLPQPEWQNGIDISSLAAGTYILNMKDKQYKSTTARKFIKN